MERMGWGQVNTVEIQSTELVKEDQEIQNDPKSLQTHVFSKEDFILSCVKQARLPTAESRGTSGTLGLKAVLRTVL